MGGIAPEAGFFGEGCLRTPGKAQSQISFWTSAKVSGRAHSLASMNRYTKAMTPKKTPPTSQVLIWSAEKGLPPPM